MRLINCKSLHSLCLESFEPCNVPKRYAILSHTWEREAGSGSTLEVLFHAFQDSSRRMNDTDATGWRKIQGACREAKAFDKSIDYVWVDSCCINKEDAAELQESINSMFKWYAQSTVCLAYLSDTKSDRLDPTSKWFTRGWTLQELVASPNVRFYNHDWQFLGDKFRLSDELAEITGIDTQLLKSSDEQSITRRLYQVPVCQKMSWASKRQTTKVEDIAYCLLGIFDINMPLLYGEREAAFQRLQEAIANKYNDLTILAWKSKDTRPESHSAKHVMYYSRTSGLVGSMDQPGSRELECYHGIFACSPREFEHSGSIASCFDHAPVFNSEYSIMHKGFKMFGILRKGYPYGSYMMPLMCSASTTTRGRRGRPGATGRSLGIFLKWVGGATYVRASCTEFKSMDPKDLEQTPGQDPFYLAPSVEQLHHSVNRFRRGSISLPQSSQVSILGTEIGIWNTKVSPGSMWDDKERIFYTYGHQSPVGCASYELAGRSGTLFIALFGLHYNRVPWLCLAGPDSSLWPSHVELRRTHLERAAFVARQKCTTRILVDIANCLGYPNQVWLTVEGSLSQQGQTHCVNISLGLDGGPKHPVTGTNNSDSDAESSEPDEPDEPDESDESEDSDDTVEDWVVVQTTSPGTPASPSSPERPASPVQLSRI